MRKDNILQVKLALPLLDPSNKLIFFFDNENIYIETSMMGKTVNKI